MYITIIIMIFHDIATRTHVYTVIDRVTKLMKQFKPSQIATLLGYNVPSKQI